LNVLIIKLAATGDVVRTTPLLRRLTGSVSWLTAANNICLLQRIGRELRCAAWEERNTLKGTTYDLVINLEDDLPTSRFLQELDFKQVFGAYADGDRLMYTADSRSWFDLSLISSFGREEADRLKLINRRTYQEPIFAGLDSHHGERYYTSSTTG
jgi:heptosyltransferase-2